MKPNKLLNIIKLSEEKLGIEDFEIQVEYQSDTIGKYNLDFNGKTFVLKKHNNSMPGLRCLQPYYRKRNEKFK